MLWQDLAPINNHGHLWQICPMVTLLSLWSELRVSWDCLKLPSTSETLLTQLRIRNTVRRWDLIAKMLLKLTRNISYRTLNFLSIRNIIQIIQEISSFCFDLDFRRKRRCSISKRSIKCANASMITKKNCCAPLQKRTTSFPQWRPPRTKTSPEPCPRICSRVSHLLL